MQNKLRASLRLCVRSKIISVNFPTGWSESKANRNSVSSVISVCHLIRADTRDTWELNNQLKLYGRHSIMSVASAIKKGVSNCFRHTLS